MQSDNSGGVISRRTAFKAALLGAAASAVAMQPYAAVAATESREDPGVVPTPLPKQKAQKEGLLDVGDGHSIWYFDTGGDGEAIVLLHAGTGSGAVWGYQQPVFSDAGYRVIGYSRRGRLNSKLGDPEKPGVGSEDLLKLIDHLGLKMVHLVGTAAGGMVATDFTVSHEGRVQSLVLVNTIVGVTNDDYRAIYKLIYPEGFDDLAGDFKELSPSYRHLDPQGHAAWLELEHKAKIGEMKGQTYANKVVWDHLAAWKLPVLVMTGDADLYTPPSMMRIQHSRIPGAEKFVVPECGHSAYWERPEIFNRVVLDFVKRNGATR